MLGGWALNAFYLLVNDAGTIAQRSFGDPDNSMRLLEVRDWLAGQGWFDVSQHRLGDGLYPMHWSRLVDLPIAGAIVVLRPFIGGAQAEIAAAAIVPLLTLLVVIATVAAITRRLAGIGVVAIAVVMVALCMPVQFQLKPLRIDHHGWQIALALAAVLPLLGRPTMRNGALAGLALATLLTVSLEGLPIAAAIMGVVALGWTVRPERASALLGLAWAAFGAAAALHAVTRGPTFFSPACDAMAPAWIAVLGAAAVALTLAVRLSGGALMRLASLAAAGAVAGAVLLWLAPQCLAGPFGNLPPRVYRIWYLSVQEGRPLFEQDASSQLALLAFPLAGLAGTAIAWRAARDEARDRWSTMAALLIAAVGISLFVLRAGATANALAIPGAAVLAHAALVRARRVHPVLPRVLATFGALMLMAPIHLGMAVLLPFHPAKKASAPRCVATDVRALGTLPAGTMFLPLDLAPELLVSTRHRAITGGYHRGAYWIDRLIVGFTAPPERARAVIGALHADYVASCADLPEAKLYARLAPGGLWGRLARGERFAWLQPVPVNGRMKVWRVIHPLPEGPARN